MEFLSEILSEKPGIYINFTFTFPHHCKRGKNSVKDGA
jgi:hypothetical protein